MNSMIGVVSYINKETSEVKFDLYTEKSKMINSFRIKYDKLIPFNVGDLVLYNSGIFYPFNVVNVNEINESMFDSLLNMYNIYFKNLFVGTKNDEFNGTLSKNNINIILDNIANYLELIRKDLNKSKTR